MSGILSSLRSKLGTTLPLSRGNSQGTTTITIEHGFIKLLVTRGLEVVDYRIALANPRYFREGLVSDSVRMAGIVSRTLAEMEGSHERVIAAVPGYQSALGRIELPKTRGLDPSVVIPREAHRTMGVSPETSYLTWHRLKDNIDRSQWLLLSAPRRSMSSLLNTVTAAGLQMSAMELRAFALARAVNQSDAVIAWTASDGCDVVVVNDATPVAHQSAYWGADPVDGNVLVDRVTAIVERTLAVYDQENLQMALPGGTGLYVSGSPVGVEQDVGQRVAAHLQLPLEELKCPLATPPDFPLNDLIVNIGLALWEA